MHRWAEPNLGADGDVESRGCAGRAQRRLGRAVVVQALVLTVLLVMGAGLVSSAVGSRWPLALLMVAMLGSGLLRLDWRRDIWRPYRSLRPRHFGIGLLGLLLPVTAYVLTADIPVLNWSLLTLVGLENGNIAAAGFEVGLVFALPYTLLLLAVLPTLALVEEAWFRRGTRGWRDGLVRSLLFGLVHTLVGVPFGVALLGLSSVGLLFTAVYLRAARRLPPGGTSTTVFPVERLGKTARDRQGMDASARLHLAYNVAVLLVVGLVLLVSPLLGVG